MTNEQALTRARRINRNYHVGYDSDRVNPYWVYFNTPTGPFFVSQAKSWTGLLKTLKRRMKEV